MQHALCSWLSLRVAVCPAPRFTHAPRLQAALQIGAGHAPAHKPHLGKGLLGKARLAHAPEVLLAQVGGAADGARQEAPAWVGDKRRSGALSLKALSSDLVIWAPLS